jgi:hypothetical protein
MFVADIMDTTLANHKVFTHQHAQDAEVTSTQYKKANGIPSPLVMTQIAHSLSQF